jgi:hypothetical protein
VHPDANAELEQSPKWTRTTLQDAGDLIGYPLILGGLNLILRSLLLHSPPLNLMPPKHLFLVQSSDAQSYGGAARNRFCESAMQEEYNSLLENQTWDLVPLLSGRKLVRCRWVYMTKSAADG